MLPRNDNKPAAEFEFRKIYFLTRSVANNRNDGIYYIRYYLEDVKLVSFTFKNVRATRLREWCRWGI